MIMKKKSLVNWVKTSLPTSEIITLCIYTVYCYALIYGREVLLIHFFVSSVNTGQERHNGKTLVVI